MKHHAIHLKIDPKRDVQTYRLKRRNVHILRLERSGSYCGDRMPETICGSYNVKRIVGLREKERVTCQHCLRLMLTRLPKRPVNPRSGMAMPRPA